MQNNFESQYKNRCLLFRLSKLRFWCKVVLIVQRLRLTTPPKFVANVSVCAAALAAAAPAPAAAMQSS